MKLSRMICLDERDVSERKVDFGLLKVEMEEEDVVV